MKRLHFLKGDDDQILSDLNQKMEQASDALEFEKAQHYLEAIRQIQYVTKNSQSIVHLQKEDFDSIGLFRKAKSVMLTKQTFRLGRLTSSNHYFFTDIAQDDEDLVESFFVAALFVGRKSSKRDLNPGFFKIIKSSFRTFERAIRQKDQNLPP